MANYLNDYPNPVITDSVFFKQMSLYVESQHHRGRPYIGEYLDETNGAWLMGDRERSRYYNHSTFCDLVITGLCGLRPQLDGSVVVNPLLPEGTWPTSAWMACAITDIPSPSFGTRTDSATTRDAASHSWLTAKRLPSATTCAA